jgi:hypothetical protein
MLYLDSNVFLYAILNDEELGERARNLLRQVQLGKENASSSALTFDEIVWVVKKYRTLKDAIRAGEAFLNFPNLKLITVNGDLLALALNLIKKHGLRPRDSIHAASAIANKTEVIVSTDEDFDRIKELSRKPL